MLIPLESLVYRWSLSGSVLHVGAHTGEEAAAYEAANMFPVYWVDGDPAMLPKLERHLRSVCDPKHQQHVQIAVVSDKPEELTFHLANNEQSSSILELGTHKVEHPDVHYIGSRDVMTTTIDAMLADGLIKRCPFVNLDIQGAELRALKGATNYLDTVKWIYSEVNEKHLYKGGALITELDDYLKNWGFRRQQTVMTPHGWGDAFYVR